MTKFEELCQASNKAVVDLHRLKQECYEFGVALAKGLMAFLECPSDRAKHYNLHDLDKPPVGPVATMEQATFVEDGWWYVGVGMDLRHGPPGVVGNTIFFNLVFKRLKDQYLVRFGRDTREFAIHPGNQAEFTAAYEHYLVLLKNHFLTEGERFLDPRHGKKMGFL
jgi:hypothetical protein